MNHDAGTHRRLEWIAEQLTATNALLCGILYVLFSGDACGFTKEKRAAIKKMIEEINAAKD